MTFFPPSGLGRPLLLDGAMGTMLQASGLPAGVSPEEFCMENPQILQNIHRAYLEAGADIITTCTFGASAYKLPRSLDVFRFNKRMAEVARAAAAASPRPDGARFLWRATWAPRAVCQALGAVEPAELLEAFARQIEGLAAGGADLIFVETQFDLAEARLAVAAARAGLSGCRSWISMTFEQGVSLTGSSPAIFAETMQNMGVDVVGTNCSLGPEQMRPWWRICWGPAPARSWSTQRRSAGAARHQQRSFPWVRRILRVKPAALCR